MDAEIVKIGEYEGLKDFGKRAPIQDMLGSLKEGEALKLPASKIGVVRKYKQEGFAVKYTADNESILVFRETAPKKGK